MAARRIRALAAAVVAGALAVAGLAGAATIVGKPGPDVLRGTGKADVLRGRAGNDLLLGGKGDDVLFGEQGNDVLVGGPGSDILRGGLGNDVLRAKDGEVDVLSCGPGRDTYAADADDVVGADCEGAPKSPSQPQSPPGGYELRVVSSAGGIVTSDPPGISCGLNGLEDGSDCSETFRAGTHVTLTAAKFARSIGFWYWSDTCTGQPNPCTVVMDGAKTVSVHYKLG